MYKWLFVVAIFLFSTASSFAMSESETNCDGALAKKVTSKGDITWWKCVNSPTTFKYPKGLDPNPAE